MQDDFKTPIKSRSTEDLILIAAEPKKWQPRVVKLAIDELSNRNVNPERIEEKRIFCESTENFNQQIKAEQNFSFFSLDPRFLFIDWAEIFMFLFSWEYEEDGFLKKAEIQRKYRPIILMVILAIIIFTFVF